MFNFAIIGGGIIGTAVAYRLKKIYPDSKIVLIEKEREIAFHQTGHNSGVIHSGIYYKPGSIQAETAVTGAFLMKEFCKKYSIPFEITGKLIVANSHKELIFLKSVYERGLKNGVPGLKILSKEEIKDLEPNISGIKAIYVPGTGIVDYRKVTAKIAELFNNEGGEIMLSTRLIDVKYKDNELILETDRGEIKTRFLITCAGLHSDRITRMGGGKPCLIIVPFRGEYYKITRKNIVKRLIYPVPDPRYPFLGVHVTKRLNGDIEAGPNAVLSLSREGYKRTEISLKDLSEVFDYPGFWRLAMKNWTTGFKEMLKTFAKKFFLNELRKLLPDIKPEELVRGTSGIRAQALSLSGKLVDDFVFVTKPRILHVCNAPSPAATASLAIAEKISDMVEQNFNSEAKSFTKKLWF